MELSDPDPVIQQTKCTCSAAANLTLLHKEVERYKALYEREREQFEEFQCYSKDLEREMDLELKQRDRKIAELETNKRRMEAELDQLKLRAENARREQVAAEEQLKMELSSVQQLCGELKQKLRAVEQANDDIERRERINAHQLLDLAERYDSCLERCALLEAGMVASNDSSPPQSRGTVDSALDISLTPPSIRETAQSRASNRESHKLIEGMIRKIEVVESQMQSRRSSLTNGQLLRSLQNGTN